jgi:hypothetical protein
MRKQLWFVIGLPILLVLGCSQKEAPPAIAEGGDTNAEAPMAAADTTAEAVALDVQNATNGAAAPPACTGHQDEPSHPKRVTAGTYCVCDDGGANEGLHPTTHVKGKHLQKEESVVIGPLADSTSVELSSNQLKFTRLEDGNGLSAMVSYEHVDESTGRHPRPVTHLVNISRWSGPAQGPALGNCDRTKNIITISYCYWDPDTTDWLCSQNVSGPHLGDIHASN